MKRLFALLLALSLVLSMVPVTSLADETEPPEATTEQLLETEAPAQPEVPETEVPATEVPVTTPPTEGTVPPTETEPAETTTATVPVVTETTPETEAPETTEVTEETTEATEETLSLLDEDGLSGTCGDNLTWTYDESTETLTISGTGAMWDYDYDYSAYTTAPWCSLSYSTLVLEEGITSIGNRAFTGSDINCDLNIPKGVTAIGEDAFQNCNIGELTLPDSLKTIGSRAFAFAGDRAIRIPAGVTTIGENGLAGYPRDEITVDPANRSFKMVGNGLYNASGTRLLAVVQGDGTFTIPDAVSQVDPLAFWNCHYTAIHLGSKVPAQFVAYQVSPFNAAFSLKAITVSASNPNYKAVDGVLFSKDGTQLISYPCQKADASYTVPDGVETILEWVFNGCDNLTELILPEGVKSIGYHAAIECLNLTSVTLPASLRNLEDQAIGYTWEGNTISNLTIRGYTGSAAETYARENGFTFESLGTVSQTGKCGANLTWTLAGTTLVISGTGAMDNYSTFWDDAALRTATTAPWSGLPYTQLALDAGITSIGNYAFYRSGLSGSVTVPEGVTAIGAYAFNSCDQITELSLPSTLKTLGSYALGRLSSDLALYIPAKLTTIDKGGISTTSWKEITVDPTNKAFRMADGGLYNSAGTRLLAALHGKGTFRIADTATQIDDQVFRNCGYSVVHIGAKVGADFCNTYNPFYDTPSLESVTVSAANPNYKAVDGVLFTKNGKRLICFPVGKAASAYTVPSGVETLIGYAFHNISGLTSLTLPDGLQTLDLYSVFQCENLKSIAIPASVKTINRYALGYTLEENLYLETIAGFTIRGYNGTTAQTYAKENGLNFESLDGKTATVTYDLNGGDDEITNPNPISCGGGNKIVLKPAVRSGYSFVGWYNENGELVTEIPSTQTEDITLTARWRVNFTVHFDPNGGSGKMKDQSTVGGAATLTKNAFTRKGYVFACWKYTAPDGTTYYLEDGRSLDGFAPDKGGQTLTLCAQWMPIKYTIAFQPNGGTGSMDSQERAYDDFDSALPENAFTRHGYTFYGWATAPKGKLVYTDGQEIAKNLTDKNGAVITLYAVWQAEKYTVHFDGTGADGGDMADFLIAYDAKTALPANRLTRTGYTFQGWALEEGCPVVYANKAKVLNLIDDSQDGTVTLYAVWAPNIYTVSFNPNGGKGTKLADIKNVQYDESLTLPTPDYTRTGYTFANWNDAKNGTGNVYEAGTPVQNLTGKNKGKATLYASWNANPYEIIFDLDGAGGSFDNLAYYDQTFTLPNSTRTGYTLAGWQTPSGKLYKAGAKVKNLTTDGSITLTAKWTPKKFTMIYRVTSPDGKKELTAKQTVTCGVETKLLTTISGIKGMHVTGWKARELGVTLTGFLTLSTEWSTLNLDGTGWAPNEYTIAYVAGDDEPVTVSCTYDQEVTLPAEGVNREGYRLTGWKLGKTTYRPGQTVKNLTANHGETVTLEAVWTPITYTVRFDANGGTGSMKPQKMTYDKAAKLTACGYKKAGYVFDGWSLTSDGEVVYGNRESVTNLANTQGTEVTLYAIWSRSKV